MPNKCDGVAKLKKLEQRLDRQFSIFGVQFGTDAIIGLVPFVGLVVAIWNGVDGANGMSTSDYAKKYGSAFY